MLCKVRPTNIQCQDTTPNVDNCKGSSQGIDGPHQKEVTRRVLHKEESYRDTGPLSAIKWHKAKIIRLSLRQVNLFFLILRNYQIVQTLNTKFT